MLAKLLFYMFAANQAETMPECDFPREKIIYWQMERKGMDSVLWPLMTCC